MRGGNAVRRVRRRSEVAGTCHGHGRWREGDLRAGRADLRAGRALPSPTSSVCSPGLI